jgi:glutamine amidotransferase-like uncharacterized protein
MFIPTTTLTQGSDVETELAYVEITSSVSITATTSAGANTVVSAGALSFDGSTRICIEFFSPTVVCGSNAAAKVQITLWDGATEGPRFAGFVGTSQQAPCLARRFLTPSAGSHTYIIKAYRELVDGTVGAGDSTTDAQTAAYVRITEA